MHLESDKLNDDWYYADRTYVTNSMLGWALSGPAYLNKKMHTTEEDTKDYLEFGKAVHMRILEPAEFARTYYVPQYNRPVNSNQRMFCEFLISTDEEIDDAALISAYKLSYLTAKLKEKNIIDKAKALYESYKQHIDEIKKNRDKIFLSKSDYERIKRIEHNISKHKRAASLLYGLGDGDMTSDSFNETIILFEDKLGRKFKSKIDRFIIDYNKKEATIVELKTHKVGFESDNMSKTMLDKCSFIR